MLKSKQLSQTRTNKSNSHTKALKNASKLQKKISPPLTQPTRQMASTPKSKNKPKSQKPQPAGVSGQNTFQQDYVSVMKGELSEINTAAHQLPNTKIAEETNQPLDPDQPLTPEQLANIYGAKAKLHLPEIPLNGSQAFWALKSDPNNPFNFPIFNLSTLLAPTDISVSIAPGDSDVPAEKVLEDYQSMMSTTIKQGHTDPQSKPYNFSDSTYNNDDLDKSLHRIANPQHGNPLTALAGSSQQLNPEDSKDSTENTAQMATSRVQFGRTVVVTAPIRKSQLAGIQKVFNIILPGEKAKTANVTPTDENPETANPLNNILCLAKAAQGNKRFDVFLSRQVKNKIDKNAMMKNNSLFNPEGLGGDNDDLSTNDPNKTAIIFTSNISQTSLKKTKTRIDQQTKEFQDRLSKQNKVYNAPFQEHVCVERNYIIELDRDPSLVAFPFIPQQLDHQHKPHPDPITHFLAFPMKASTITYSITDPLEEPSNDLNFRLTEAEFLIQCCLMGQNFPAPIDPRFKPLIEQDRNGELTPEESQKAREVMGRSVVAVYGHGSGLAAEQWGLKASIVKPELMTQGVPQPPQMKPGSNPVVNYELDISYGHNALYQTMYNFSLLPTESEIQENLRTLREQALSMSGANQSLLDQISKETSDVFNTENNNTNRIVPEINFANMSIDDIEDELSFRLREIEQRQYQFQHQLDEEMRFESIRQRRGGEYQDDGDGDGDGSSSGGEGSEVPQFIDTTIVEKH